jgi:hypothetical protein
MLPADELAWLRDEMARLRSRHDEIRQGVLDGDLDPRGETCRLRFEDEVRETISPELARRFLTGEQLEAITVRKKIVIVRVVKQRGGRVRRPRRAGARAQ